MHRTTLLAFFRFAIFVWAAACGSVWVMRPANGQSRIPTFPPEVVGFKMPDGPRQMMPDQRVTTKDTEGEVVVGKVHIAVGENRIILLPDGQLVPRMKYEFTDTDRPFKPLAKEEVASRLTAGKFKGFKTKLTRHFVFIYNTSEEFTLVTSRVLESMIPGTMSYFETNKIKTKEPDLPLVVIMFRKEEEFQAYQQMPPGVVAYYTPASNYVVLYEESKLAEIKQELAVQQALGTIAHEGAHQLLHNIGLQQRLSRWPMWISEGIAEYLAPTAPGKNFRWAGAGVVNQMRMFELENYLKSRDSEQASGEMVQNTVIAARLTSTGYATAWALTHHLAKNHRIEFHKYLQEVSKLGPLEGDAQRVGQSTITGNQIAFQKFFGDDYGAIEKKQVQHLKKLPYTDPFADFVTFVTFISAGSGRQTKKDANLFHSPSLAEKWREESLEKLPAELRPTAQSTTRMYVNRAAAEAAARQFLQAR